MLCIVSQSQSCHVMSCGLQAGMELRLLHTVAHRQTWYGRWGFAFGRGGFAIGKQVSGRPLICRGISAHSSTGPILVAC